MKRTHAIIHYLNGEIPESKLLELVPETRDLLAGLKEVYQALAMDRGSKVTVCVFLARVSLPTANHVRRPRVKIHHHQQIGRSR